MKRNASHQINHQHKNSADNSAFEAIRQKVKTRLFGDIGKLVIHKNSSDSIPDLSKSKEENIQKSVTTPCSRRQSLLDLSAASDAMKIDEQEPKDDTCKNIVFFEVPEAIKDEDEQEDAPDLTTKSVGIRRPIFTIDPQKEIADLKEELQIKDNPDIHVIQDGFCSYYKECETLGQGTSGIVKKCIKNGTDDHYAVKIVKYNNDTELLVLIVNEFKNHHKLSHKNIIKVYELYIDYVTKKIFTIMELADCREMFEVIQNLGHYSEAVASGIFKQILTGISYLHLNGVCHRDLKPDNILVSSDGQIVKITDFNVSRFVENKSKKKYSSLSKENLKMLTYTGTIAFTAPEVFQELEYTETVDMWSAGAVLYTMLCGYQPFHAEFTKDLIELIKEAKYEFHDESWSTISQPAKELISRCLDPNYKTRILPSEGLMHPWIANQGNVPDSCTLRTKDNLASSALAASSIHTRTRGESFVQPLLASPVFEKKHSMPASRRKTVNPHNHDEFEFYRKKKEDSNKKSDTIKKLAPLKNKVDHVEEQADEDIISPITKKGVRMFVDIEDILAGETDSPNSPDELVNLQLLHLAKVKEDPVPEDPKKLGKTC